MQKHSIVILLFLSLSICTVAQNNEDCELTLGRAFEEFNGGHFYSIPSILDPCLNQFTSEQRQRAYLLLTQTYLLLDDPLGAKQSYLSLLRANPEFQTDTAVHPIDVIYLSKKFTATSLFAWSVKAGPSITVPRLIYNLNPFGEANASEKYKLKFGFHAGAGGDVTITENLNLRGELIYSLSVLKQESSNHWNGDTKELIERQGWLSLPITFMYNWHYGKYRPYGYLGYGVHYVLSDKAIITTTNNRPAVSDINDREETSEESPEFDLLYQRNRFNHSVIAGGGVKVKVGLDFLFIDVRYNIGLKNITSPKNVYSNADADPVSGSIINSFDSSIRFAQVADYLRLDNLSVSVGFLRPLYKPRELKRARTKSLMKQLK